MSTVSKTAKKYNNFKSLVNGVFNSKLFPFAMAAVMVLCYYTSIDLAAIYFVAVVGILIFTLSDDLTPAITLFAFINIIVSYKNSPSYTAGGSDYYFQTHVLIQIIILVGLLVAAAVFRLIKTVYTRKFKPTPVFYGLCALAAVFLINGAFSANYTFANLIYGFIQAVIYLGVFALLKDNFKFDKDTFEKIALNFLALSIVLVIELAVAYLTYDNLYENGVFIRDYVSFGWGVYNTMGLLLVLCIPSVMYLASKYKYGFILTIYSIILAIACVFTTSKQALIGILIVYPICFVCLFVWAKKKLSHLIVYIVTAVCGIIFVAVCWDFVYNTALTLIGNVFVDGHFYASNRTVLYGLGFEHFESAPVLGVGFFRLSLINGAVNNSSGLSMMPDFYHNTLLQMAASCGVIGFIIYVVHRCQTVISFFNNATKERLFIAATILVILVLSLFDVHMFDIMPTFTYSALLAVLVASENKKTKQPKPLFVIQV